MRAAISSSLALVSALAATLLLSSCVTPIWFLFYNAAGADVTIVAKNRYGDTDPVNIPAEQERLVPCQVGTYEIVSHEKVWRYRLDALNTETIEISWYRRPWATDLRVIRVQLIEDGRLYLLSESQTAPVSAFTEQPKGFPLSPL